MLSLASDVIEQDYCGKQPGTLIEEISHHVVDISHVIFLVIFNYFLRDDGLDDIYTVRLKHRTPGTYNTAPPETH